MSSLPNPNYLMSPTVSRRGAGGGGGGGHKRSMSADFDAVGLGIGLGFGNSPRSATTHLQQSPQTPPRPPPPIFSMLEDLDKDFSFPNFKDSSTSITPPHPHTHPHHPPPPPSFKFNQFHRPSKSLNSPIRFQRTDSSIKEIEEEDDDEDEEDDDKENDGDDDDDGDLVDDDASSYSFFATPRSAANASRYHRIISNVNGVERTVTPPTTLTTPEIIITNEGNAGNKDLYIVESSDSSNAEKISTTAAPNNASSSSLSKETPTPTPTPTPASFVSPIKRNRQTTTITSISSPKITTSTSTAINTCTTPVKPSETPNLCRMVTPPQKSVTDLPSPRRPESPAEKKILRQTKIPGYRKTNRLTQPASSSSLSTARTAITTNTINTTNTAKTTSTANTANTTSTTSSQSHSINTAITASPQQQNHHLSRNDFKHRGFLRRRGSNATDTSSVSSITSKLKRSSRIFDWLRKKS